VLPGATPHATAGASAQVARTDFPPEFDSVIIFICDDCGQPIEVIEPVQ
jgi:hypothetical protein